MRRTKPILLTFVATTAFWMAVVVGLVLLTNYFGEPKGAVTLTQSPTNNVSILVLGGLTREFALTFHESGDTPTNFLSTNNLVLTRPLHSGQEFQITIQELKRADPWAIDHNQPISSSNLR